MLVGGVLAWAVAATRVVLPYDEAFLGLDRVNLTLINARLLAFMAHDRVALAGTMLSIGVLYAGLAGWGVRDGARWAWRVVVGSAAVGFASFFLFLGFGYFDPLHAAVSVPLLVLFLLGLRNAPPPGAVGSAYPSLRNDRRWHLALWGQLTFVSLGVGLIAAGAAIATIGVGGVLVPEDVHFLGAPAEALRAANARLLPLVAHDRAGFGGALVSDGICVLLTSLWGFRRGARWVWWMLLLSGVPGFGAALGVHLAIGYLELTHVAPAIVGAILFSLGLTLSHAYLSARDQVGSFTS
jgi:dihydroorotate dehydrogenase